MSPVAGATDSIAGFQGSELPPGVTPPSTRERSQAFLSDVIVELGLVDAETVEQAVEAARSPGQTVARILLDTGALNEDQLSRAVAERHGLDHVDLEQFEVDPEAAALISRSAALRYRALPIAFAADGAVIVAIEDPVDALAINDTAEMTRSEVRTVVASGHAIEALIEELPYLDDGTAPRRESSTLAASAAVPPPPAPADRPVRDPVDDPFAPSASSDPPPQPLEERSTPTAIEAELASERAARAAAEQELASERAGRAELEGERSKAQATLETISEELERTRGNLVELEAQLERAEARSGELEQRVGELEDADRRAETARHAMAELRDEIDREREQSARSEEKLRSDLTTATARCDQLERSLSILVAAASDLRRVSAEFADRCEGLSGSDAAENGRG